MDEEAVYRLIEGIVLQANRDYRAAFKRKLRRKKVSDEKKRYAADAERFFQSSWFEFLANLDGEDLMKKIEEDEREKKQEEDEEKAKKKRKEKTA